MKRLIAAAVLLVIIVMLCITGNVYVVHACQDTTRDIENFYTQICKSDNPNFDKLSKELNEKWIKRKEKLGLFVNHEFLDKISLYISELPMLVKIGNKNEIALVCENIKTICNQMTDEQKFALHSFY